MTIESGIENAGAYIDDLDDTYPAGGDDLVEGDNHIRGIKNCLLNSFPAITGAVTSTHTELNLLDGATVTTAEINYNDITTLGTVESSKTVTADSNGYVTFDCTVNYKSIKFITADDSSSLYLDTAGVFGTYDDYNSADIWKYTPHATPGSRVFAITPPVTIGTLTATTLTVGTTLNIPADSIDTTEIATGAVTTAKIADDAVTDAKLESPAVGSTVIKRIKGVTPQTGTNNTYATWNTNYDNPTGGVFLLGHALVSGALRIYCDLYADVGSSQAYARPMVTGTFAAAEQSVLGTTPTTLTFDITVTAGDTIQLFTKVSVGDTWSIRYIHVAADHEMMAIA